MASQSPTDDRLTDSYANGWLAMSRMIWSGASWSGRERNCGFINLRNGRFADISAIAGFDFLDDARALVVSDWDHDGDPDLWLKNRTGPQLRFLENQSNATSFLGLELQGTTSNRDAVGARVQVVTDDGTYLQQVSSGSGYLAQSSKTLLFGLPATATPQRIAVQWPDGSRQELTPPPSGRYYRLVQGAERFDLLKERNLELPEPIEPPTSKPSDAARIVLREPVPVPPNLIAAQDLPSLNEGQPTLLMFWAHWCQICAAELMEFTRRTDEWQDRGIQVIPMSLDPLEERAKTQRAAQRLRLQTPVHFVNDDQAALFSALLKSVLDIHQSMTVPLSLLINGQGELQVIYSGPAGVDQLLNDCTALESASPLTNLTEDYEQGRWHAPPRRSYAGVVEDLRAERLVDWARFYLRLDRSNRSR